jgi:23S rRNA (pseudouridine1915-N3)-methyltransferase
MKLQFIWIGKAKSAAIAQLVDDYLGRVKKFARLEVSEIRDRQESGKRLMEREAEEILGRLDADTFVVALDERGRELPSQQLAEFFRKHQVNGTQKMAFIIGGHLGLAQSVKERADLLLSLSQMTLTHELARIFLVEQVYRAFAILHNLPYQK